MVRKYYLAAVLTFVLIFSASLGFSAQSPYCEVARISGSQVQVKRGGQTTDLKVGDMLGKGDSLIIGKDSFVDIAFDEE